jgi:hypothetical protein
MLLVGLMGLEEHQRRRSTVAGVRPRWRLEWQQGVEARQVERKGVVATGDKYTAVWRMGYAWRWRMVTSADREVAGGHVAVTHEGPASRRRLETLHTSGCCMCGSWKSGGSWQRSAGMATRRWRSRPRRCLNTRWVWSV